MTTSPDSSNVEKNILIVDDEARIGRFVSMYLDRVGYNTSTCQSVDEARRLLQSKKWSLVLTDLVMPQETGFDLLQWISENCPDIPVVVLTAHSSPMVVDQVNQAQAAAIINKPFSLGELYKTISLAMGG
jgi:two-component system response regulator PilR (NtrC family)